MSTVNLDHVLPQNQRIAKMINDIGELLLREDFKSYELVILVNFEFNKKLNSEEEKKFLYRLYNCMIDKLKEIDFDKDEGF